VKSQPETLEPASASEWREWLEANGADSEPVTLVLQKKGSPYPGVDYAHALDEALCYGWIDSTVHRLDEHRYTALFARRRRGSIWSAVNKRHIARLEAEGRMAPPGRAAVEAAKADGSWTVLDTVEALELPAELAEALDAAGVRVAFDSIPESERKQWLWRYVRAKRPETRAKWLGEMITAARERGAGPAAG
jgi:uncharacterized protein YdeI (YjbR/CyaY-like superfamily)